MSTRISWDKHTFSGDEYIGIYFFQITDENLLIPIIFRLESREKGKF